MQQSKCFLITVRGAVSAAPLAVRDGIIWIMVIFQPDVNLQEM